MALIGFRGGGEHGNLVGWAAVSGAVTRDPATILTGMGGPASIKHDGSATGASRFVFAGGTSEYATVYFSFKFRIASIAAPATAYNKRLVFANNGTLNVGGFRLSQVTNGNFQLLALNADLSGTGSSVGGNWFTAGLTHVISGKFVAGNPGSIEVNIDGVQRLPPTAINTTMLHPAGTAGSFVLQALSAYARVMNYGDFLFDDTAIPPAATTVIARQFKSGTPAYDAFSTVGGGTKHGNISESPPSATLAIVSPSGLGQVAQTCLINSFSVAETGKGAGTISGSDQILGVRVEAWAKTSGVADNGNVGSTRLRLGGVDTDALTGALGTADLFLFGAVQGAALADLNAGEAGWVKAATTLARAHTVEDMWVTAAYGPAGSSIIGSLAAIETGSDTASLAGAVFIEGDLAAQEVGDDVAAFAGAVFIEGDLAAAETGSDSAAFSGAVGITGALAATEVGQDTAAFFGGQEPSIVGILDAHETGSDSAAIIGRVAIGGALSAQEVGADTAAFTGSTTTEPGTQGVGVWTGAGWVNKPAKVWDGTAWIEKPVKVWDGGAWA